jgi:hypothetical protein
LVIHATQSLACRVSDGLGAAQDRDTAVDQADRAESGTLTEPEITAMQGTVPEVRSTALAAIGALTRNDVATAYALLHHLARRHSTAASTAAEILADVVLNGLPRNGAGIDLRLALLTELRRWDVTADGATAHAAADLVTRVATRDDTPAGGHREVAEAAGVEVLLTLANAAAARIKRFVDLDSEVVEAYFAHRCRTAADRSGLGRHLDVQ